MRIAIAAALVAGARVASADDDCRGIEVELTPAESLQLVAWIEDAAGTYVDTAFVTQTTGLRGLGNRPGQVGLNSGPLWPYGRREDVLPIWAHRHGLTFPLVVWQIDRDEPDDTCILDTAFALSSLESYYCRPRTPTEESWDAGTCATHVFTDKGAFSSTRTSPYPPRGDLSQARADSDDVATYATSNPFDTVSRATPPADVPYAITWVAPPSLPSGTYVLRVEAAKEFDFNTTYTANTYPSTQCVYREYGVPYRGQPSVLYEVAFTLADTESRASTDTYAGYSGDDGAVHPPDATITTTTPGSGASRLRLVVAEDSSLYRVRVTARPEQDTIAPGTANDATVDIVDETHAEISFTAPGDDGQIGTVAGYELRFRIGDDLDETSFASATPIDAIDPLPPGERQTLVLADLAPRTRYVVGIRAYDNCTHAGPLVVVRFETTAAEVSGCGCRSGGSSGLLVGLALLLSRRRR